VIRPHAAIIIYFRRPRVYRDEKRVFHDIFDYQWNLSDLRWSIRFRDLHIDGPTNLGQLEEFLLCRYLCERTMRRSTLVSVQNAEYS
jgi:hypothetical protein